MWGIGGSAVPACRHGIPTMVRIPYFWVQAGADAVPCSSFMRNGAFTPDGEWFHSSSRKSGKFCCTPAALSEAPCRLLAIIWWCPVGLKIQCYPPSAILRPAPGRRKPFSLYLIKPEHGHRSFLIFWSYKLKCNRFALWFFRPDKLNCMRLVFWFFWLLIVRHILH